MFTKPATKGFFASYLPFIVRTVTRLQYDYLSRMDRQAQITCLNYGYHDPSYDRSPLELPPHLRSNRYQLQLFHHVASAVPWTGLDVLEVGSGRGGGAAYLTSCLAPRSYVGLDLAHAATDFCRHYYSIPGLSFETGNAEELPFGDGRFDIVLNVESSLYYPRLDRFLSEVVRVLKPGGHFLYADIRYWDEMSTWRRQLGELGLEPVSEEDITPQVRQALELDRMRKLRLLAGRAPRLLRGGLAEFAGLTGAGLYRDRPENGKRIYLNFVFRKPG